VALRQPLGDERLVPIFVRDDEIVVEQDQVQRPALQAAAMTNLLTAVSIGSRQKAPPNRESPGGARHSSLQTAPDAPGGVEERELLSLLCTPRNPSLLPIARVMPGMATLSKPLICNRVIPCRSVVWRARRGINTTAHYQIFNTLAPGTAHRR
jgi:hypothetical protein